MSNKFFQFHNLLAVVFRLSYISGCALVEAKKYVATATTTAVYGKTGKLSF